MNCLFQTTVYTACLRYSVSYSSFIFLIYVTFLLLFTSVFTSTPPSHAIAKRSVYRTYTCIIIYIDRIYCQWSILKHAAAYWSGAKRCNLCLDATFAWM